MQIATYIVVGFHIVFSVGLIVLILLHAGRGGGLSDMFGGGMMSSNLGGSTLAERNLDRLTVVVALLFAVTTLALSWLLAI